MLLTSVIRAHLEALFGGRPVESFSQFRVTRDSDLAVDEDDVANLRQALRSGLTHAPLRTGHPAGGGGQLPAEALWRFLLDQFALPEAALYRVNGPVNLVRLNQLIDQAELPTTCALPRPSRPGRSAACPAAARSWRACAEADVLLHHPFESFEPVVALPARGGARPRRAGHQADHLPHRQPSRC